MHTTLQFYEQSEKASKREFLVQLEIFVKELEEHIPQKTGDQNCYTDKVYVCFEEFKKDFYELYYKEFHIKKQNQGILTTCL
jgi:hypothetical protein